MARTVEMRASGTLADRVDRIIDEGSSRRRSVLVRVASPDLKDRDRLMDILSEVVETRIRASTARDLIPPDVKYLAAGTNAASPAATRKKLQDHKGSAATMMAARLDNLTDLADLKGRRLEKLREVAAPGLHLDLRRDGLGHRQRRPQEVLPRGAGRRRHPREPGRQAAPTRPGQELHPGDDAGQPNEHVGPPRDQRPRRLGAWGATGNGVTVGLLDTGVDAGHPDLTGKLADWAEFDANGLAVAGSQPHDSDRHGTHCAGTIVGGKASGRHIGVAPGAKLAAAMVLNGETGTDAQILAGLKWVTEKHVDVISMSLGGLTFDAETPSTYTAAIVTALMAGIPVVAAIGNEGPQTTGDPGNDYFPFSVGATDYCDLPAGFSGGRTHLLTQSNYIPARFLPLPYFKPEVTAPGVAVYSAVPGGGWESFNGTSMATPHVAGAMALVLSATNRLKDIPADRRGFLIRELIASGVEELGESGWDSRFGYGRIDVLRSIGFAKSQGY